MSAQTNAKNTRAEDEITEYTTSGRLLLLFRVDIPHLLKTRQIRLYLELSAQSTTHDKEVLAQAKKDKTLSQFEPIDWTKLAPIPIHMEFDVVSIIHITRFTFHDIFKSIQGFEEEILRLLCQHVFLTATLKTLATIQLTDGQQLLNIPIQIYPGAGIPGLTKFAIIGLLQPEVDRYNLDLHDWLFSWFVQNAEKKIKTVLLDATRNMLTGVFGPKHH